MSQSFFWIAFALVVITPLHAADTVQTTPPSEADITKFKLDGDPASERGATWTYESTDTGVDYKLTGTLFKPPGTGPFPAVLLSHGMGNYAQNYGAKLSTEMVKWGLVCIAPNYTYGARARAAGSPGVVDIQNTNIPDNLKRAHKCFDLLASLGYVDMKRVAVHGHSKGAFLTVAIAGAYPDEIRAASHTAGGEQSYNKDLSLKITTPYSIHHGDADTSVRLSADVRFEATLTQNKVEHEMRVYPGMTHLQIPANPVVLERIRAWYMKHGVLAAN
ncbi:MAG: dienelactone hydrolase family protein [Verrucomicrobiaceae bacterium]|nr:dienelactone hydrolase family protein [Verrucomicrobiaceae bacterium]